MWVIAIFIVPAFVIWNIGSAIKNRQSGFVGTLYGKKVATKEFMAEKHAAANEALLKYGQNAPEGKALDEQAWTRMILIREAEKRNIKVSDSELLAYIKTLPTFRNADLTPENYTYMIGRMFNETPEEFEEGVRHSLMIAKLMNELIKDISVSEDEVFKSYAKENEQASVSYVVIKPENFVDDVKIDNEQVLKDYYEQNKESFKKPEQVDAEYIEVKLDNFKPQIKISEDQIKKYYDANKENYILSGEEGKTAQYKPLEEVKQSISDILTEKEMNMLAQNTARKIITKLYSADNFQSVAKEFNLTAKRTGPFSMLQEIPNVGLSFPFLKAAFDLKVGEISEIIKTPTALYILKPVKKIKPYIPEFAEVTAEVKEKYKQDQSVNLAGEKARQTKQSIVDLMDKEKLDFKQAAEKLGLTVKESGEFTRSGYVSELGFAKDFTETAFSLKPGKISDPVSSSLGFCIMELNNLTPVDKEKFAQEKEQFTQKVLAQKKNSYLNDWFTRIRNEANPQVFADENE